MQAALRKLADYAKAHHIRLYLAMTPDIHNLIDYKFTDSSIDRCEGIAEADGYIFVDLLPAFAGCRPSRCGRCPAIRIRTRSAIN